ncbi:MAG: D-aminoacyl-tRNA deacylase [Gemmatimonadota bacterium]|nr:D-aminoacyl-tRNA deacylase [Gemmatimonadota bacterium]
MRVVLQRVAEASVEIDGAVTGSIGPGLVVLAGFTDGDGPDTVSWMADKIANLRIFADAEGRMNRSVLDIGGEVLVVSQFTLYGDARKGRRPSFVKAARPETAVPLYEGFVTALEGVVPRRVQTGRFGAAMNVSLVNDGPVTLMIER